MSRVIGSVMLLMISTLVFANQDGIAWSDPEHNCSFTMPGKAWRNTTDGKLGLLKDSFVEFMSLEDYSIFSLAYFEIETDEAWKTEISSKTIETTQSMIRALSDRVWLIRDEPGYLVSGKVGYKRELGYQVGGIDYAVIIVVIPHNNRHYRLLLTALEQNYSTAFADFRKIIQSFKLLD